MMQDFESKPNRSYTKYRWLFMYILR